MPKIISHAYKKNEKYHYPSGGSGGVGKHIGEPFFYPSKNTPPGAIRGRGELFSRTLYPSLWAWARAEGLVKTEAQWQALAASQFGYCQYYSDGDGATTFRAPFYGRVLAAAATDAEVNAWVKDAIVNITGQALSGGINGYFSASGSSGGAFRKGDSVAGTLSGVVAAGSNALGFDASLCVNTGPEVTMRAVHLPVYIHAYDEILEPAQANAAEVLAALGNKLDISQYNTDKAATTLLLPKVIASIQTNGVIDSGSIGLVSCSVIGTGSWNIVTDASLGLNNTNKVFCSSKLANGTFAHGYFTANNTMYVACYNTNGAGYAAPLSILVL